MQETMNITKAAWKAMTLVSAPTATTSAVKRGKHGGLYTWVSSGKRVTVLYTPSK